MFREEAIWVHNVLIELPLSGGKVANLGSSTSEFRKKIQPHINDEIIAPLEAKGAQIVNIDIKKDEGVDIEADLSAINFSEFVNQSFDLIICTNMLEHVVDISLVIDNILKIASPNAYILLTVPKKYPLHFDPIDNGFRPNPAQLAELFLNKTKYQILDSRIISIKDTKYYPFKKSSFPLWGYRLRLKFWMRYYYEVTGLLLKRED